MKQPKPRASQRALDAIGEEQAPAPRFPYVTVLTGRLAGKTCLIEQGGVTIGRDAEATVYTEDPAASRLHATIDKTAEGAITLTDNASTNGTFCNGKRIDRCELSDGDKVLIGATVLRFGLYDELEVRFMRQQYEATIRDSLTGCYNRCYLADYLPAELSFGRRHETPLALAMCDLDHFKRINDTYGHLCGDAVLRAVACQVGATLRKEDTLVRYGGEEFVIVMPKTGGGGALVLAERVRRNVEECSVFHKSIRIRATLSIGVAVAEPHRDLSTEELLRQADGFLYAAKGAGRNRVMSSPEQPTRHGCA